MESIGKGRVKSNLTAILLVAALTIGTSNGFVPLRPSLSHPNQVSHKLRSSPNDQDEAKLEVPEKDVSGHENENPLSKLNSFLDTPILDANNKDDQGPIAEALKNFVRDDSEMASLTFSVIVVIFFAVVTRGAMYVVNGY